MAVEKSYARLGLFVMLTLVVVLATALLFIQRLRSRAVIEMVTFTTENVSGLDVSSPVRFRGVPVGRVSGLQFDPRTTMIRIDFQIFHDRLTSIGASVQRVQGFSGLAALRAQVVSNPVTGESYLLLDVPRNAPPPIALGFTPDRLYVPSAPTPLSTMRDRLPEVLERAEATLQTLRDIVVRIPDSLDRSDRFFTNVERIIRESQLPELSADSRKFFTTTSTQIEQLTTNLDKLVGERGSLAALVEDAHTSIEAADLPGTTKSARDALERTSLAADDLRRSLPAIRDSLEQLRQLARLLEEQPESVLYGPRPTGVKPQ
jgi:ABC-type transporter Mla subunit MlaD